jgi:hypothetical protein
MCCHISYVDGTQGQTDRYIDREVDGWMDGGQTDRRMYGRVERQMDNRHTRRFCLLNVAVSKSEYTAPKDWMIENKTLERMWKEAVMT